MPFGRRSHLLATLAVAGFLSATAADAAAEVPTIVVSPYLVATPIARAGSSVSVIRREAIERSAAGTVAGLLRTVPGLLIEERGGAGGQTRVSLRGAEAQHTLVLIDGVRVNDPAGARADFDFAVLSLTDVERIEVLRGPQSALYGSDAMGGVINIITRRPPAGVRSSAVIEGGSYGTRGGGVSVSGGSERARALFSGSYFASEGFSRVGDRDGGEADATEKRAGTFRAAVTGRAGTRLEVGLDAHHQRSDIDRSASQDAAGYTSERQLLNGFGRIFFPGHGGRLRNQVTVYAARSERTFAEPTRTTFYRGGTSGLAYRGTLSLPSPGNLVFGGSLEAEDAYRKRSTAPAPDYDDARTLFAGYLLYQLPLDRLNLSFALRHDGAAGEAGFTTGRVTAVYELAGTETRLRASLGTGAKRPTAFQLSYNAGLAAETSVGADLGVDTVLHDGRLTLSATGFWNRFANLIDWDGDFFTGTYRNVAAAETAGLELAAHARLVPGVLFGTASYTLLYSRDLATGEPLQRRPRHSATLALTYSGIARLEATVAATVVGSRFNRDGGKERLPAYARIDLRADYRVNGNLTLFGRIDNLLDADYEEVKGYNTPGLSAYAGLRWSG